MPYTPQVSDLQKIKSEFVSLASLIERAGIPSLMTWLDKTDFYSAPASTKYHGSWQGGLCSHSIDTYWELSRLEAAYPELDVFLTQKGLNSAESVAIVALFHDLCKVNFYKPELRNRKNEAGEWESYTGYAIEEKFRFGGHGSKSVFLLQNFIKLKPEEAVAINCHMGIGDGKDYVSEAYEQNPLAFLLHVADEAACFLKPIDRSGEV